jgi:hypothetical protein
LNKKIFASTFLIAALHALPTSAAVTYEISTAPDNWATLKLVTSDFIHADRDFFASEIDHCSIDGLSCDVVSVYLDAAAAGINEASPGDQAFGLLHYYTPTYWSVAYLLFRGPALSTIGVHAGTGYSNIGTLTVSAVPEPRNLGYLFLGLPIVIGLSRRNRK